MNVIETSRPPRYYMCVVGVSIISKAALQGFGRNILFPGNIFFNAVVARSDPICDIITRPKKKICLTETCIKLHYTLCIGRCCTTEQLIE